MPPPRFVREPNLNTAFGADPFDPRFVNNDAKRSFTDLGLLVEVFEWLKSHPQLITPDMEPIFHSVKRHLTSHCPDAVGD